VKSRSRNYAISSSLVHVGLNGLETDTLLVWERLGSSETVPPRDHPGGCGCAYVRRYRSLPTAWNYYDRRHTLPRFLSVFPYTSASPENNFVSSLHSSLAKNCTFRPTVQRRIATAVFLLDCVKSGFFSSSLFTLVLLFTEVCSFPRSFLAFRITPESFD